jgi:hypothetical protein
VLRDLFFCSGIFIEEGLGLERLWAWRGPTTMTVMEAGGDMQGIGIMSWLNLLPWRIFIERL